MWGRWSGRAGRLLLLLDVGKLGGLGSWMTAPRLLGAAKLVEAVLGEALVVEQGWQRAGGRRVCAGRGEPGAGADADVALITMPL